MNKALRTVLVIIAIIALISTVSYCRFPYDTEQAVFTTTTKTITGSGYVMRKETLVSNDITGVFESLVKEGERVAKGSIIGSVISGNLDKKLAADLEEVNSRIEQIEKSESIADLYSSDDARVFSAIKSLASSVREEAGRENYSEAQSYKEQLNTIIERKYSGEKALARDKLLISLEEERYNLEQQIGGIRSEIKAPAAGIFYSVLDGLESSCSESYVTKLSCSDIEEFAEKTEEYKQDKTVVAKITDSYTWYLASVIPTDDAQAFRVGDSVKISVDEKPQITATVAALNDDGSGETALIIKSTKNVKGITEKRTVEFEICTESYSGIKIPVEAIRVKDSVTGVYVMSKHRAVSFRAVEIIARIDDFYIVRQDYIPEAGSNLKSVKVYDDILINPEKAIKEK